VLSSIRVLDFTWKTVERAGGWDDHRFAAHPSRTTDTPEPTHVQGEKPLYPDPYFNTLHHGKLAISLNTRTPEGITIVERLLLQGDALVEHLSVGAHISLLMSRVLEDLAVSSCHAWLSHP
jgi:crotonobetainyl-CoA:carnitine CoA-transferase CaiB-like acyl-CoA transferase